MQVLYVTALIVLIEIKVANESLSYMSQNSARLTLRKSQEYKVLKWAYEVGAERYFYLQENMSKL